MRTRNTLNATQAMARHRSSKEFGARNPITGDRGVKYTKMSSADQENQVKAFSNFMDSKIQLSEPGKRNRSRDDHIS